MIRYYGIYARHREIDKKLHRIRSTEKQKCMISFTKWRNSILLSFGYDPLLCPSCNKEMQLLELYHKHKKVSLEDLYEGPGLNILQINGDPAHRYFTTSPNHVQ